MQGLWPTIRVCTPRTVSLMRANTKTGDYTDVKVVSPYGEIAWNQLGRTNRANTSFTLVGRSRDFTL